MTAERTAEEWALLTDAGLTFLVSRARDGRTTSYTEMNAVLQNRVGLGFDFSDISERNAMGDLLGRITALNRPETNLMISALVMYLNENTPGPGFYTYAQQLGALRVGATTIEKETFWVEQVAGLHDHYRKVHQ